MTAGTSTRVYLRGGRVAHLLPESSSPNSADSALCGVNPGIGYFALWHGTGAQDEWDKAEAMPVCFRCAVKA